MATQTSPQSPPNPGSLFFGDARTCKAWLKSIPLTNIAQAQKTILDSLRIVNLSSEILPLERLTCMELMRDKVAERYALANERSGYRARQTAKSDAARSVRGISNS